MTGQEADDDAALKSPQEAQLALSTDQEETCQTQARGQHTHRDNGISALALTLLDDVLFL